MPTADCEAEDQPHDGAKGAVAASAVVPGPGVPGRVGPPERPDRLVQFLIAHPLLVRVLIYGVVLGAIGSGLFMWLTGRLDASNAGYTGVFIINLVGSGSIVVPVPGFAAVCASASESLGLNLPALAAAGAGGAAIGEITGYLAGFGGQGFVSRFRFYARIHGWVLRRGGLALFVMAALPNPLFDVAGLVAGSLGYPLHKFVLYVFAGKLVRYAGLAYGCRLGIDWISGLT